MKVRNLNSYFGMEGPFEVESKESFADEMMPMFERWAKEDYDDPEFQFTKPKEETIRERVSELREYFIKGLEETLIVK